MKKPEVVTRVLAFIRPLYAATPKILDLTVPCSDCGKKVSKPQYLYVKLEFCPHCGLLRHAGATNGYDWLR